MPLTKKTCILTLVLFLFLLTFLKSAYAGVEVELPVKLDCEASGGTIYYVPQLKIIEDANGNQINTFEQVEKCALPRNDISGFFDYDISQSGAITVTAEITDLALKNAIEACYPSFPLSCVRNKIMPLTNYTDPNVLKADLKDFYDDKLYSDIYNSKKVGSKVDKTKYKLTVDFQNKSDKKISFKIGKHSAYFTTSNIGAYTIYLEGDNSTFCSNANPCNFNTIYQNFQKSVYYVPNNNTDYFTELTGTSFQKLFNSSNLDLKNISSLAQVSGVCYQGTYCVETNTSAATSRFVFGNAWTGDSSTRIYYYIRFDSVTEFRFAIWANSSINVTTTFFASNGAYDINNYQQEFYFVNNTATIPANTWTEVSVPLREIQRMHIAKNTYGLMPPQGKLPSTGAIYFYINSSGPVQVRFDKIYGYMPITFDKINENEYWTNANYVIIGATNYTRINSLNEKLHIYGNNNKYLQFSPLANITLQNFVNVMESPIPNFYYMTSDVRLWTPNYQINGLTIKAERNLCEFNASQVTNASTICLPNMSCCMDGRQGTKLLIMNPDGSPLTPASSSYVQNAFLMSGAEGGNLYAFTNGGNFTKIYTADCGEACIEAFGGNYDVVTTACSTKGRSLMYHCGQGVLQNVFIYGDGCGGANVVRYYSTGATNMTFKKLWGYTDLIHSPSTNEYAKPAWQQLRIVNDVEFFVYYENGTATDATVNITDNYGTSYIFNTVSGYYKIELPYRFWYRGNFSDGSYDRITQDLPAGQTWFLVSNGSKFKVGDIIRIVCSNTSFYIPQVTYDLQVTAINGNNVTVNQSITSPIGYFQYSGWQANGTCYGMVRKKPSTGWTDTNLYYNYTAQICKPGFECQTVYFQPKNPVNQFSIYLKPQKVNPVAYGLESNLPFVQIDNTTTKNTLPFVLIGNQSAQIGFVKVR